MNILTFLQPKNVLKQQIGQNNFFFYVRNENNTEWYLNNFIQNEFPSQKYLFSSF